MKCYCGRKMKKTRDGGIRCVNGGKHRDRKTQQQIAEGAARKMAAMDAKEREEMEGGKP